MAGETASLDKAGPDLISDVLPFGLANLQCFPANSR
jgi:hypothetical protein